MAGVQEETEGVCGLPQQLADHVPIIDVIEVVARAAVFQIAVALVYGARKAESQAIRNWPAQGSGIALQVVIAKGSLEIAFILPEVGSLGENADGAGVGVLAV